MRTVGLDNMVTVPDELASVAEPKIILAVKSNMDGRNVTFSAEHCGERSGMGRP